jgi:hypothetical protein
MSAVQLEAGAEIFLSTSTVRRVWSDQPFIRWVPRAVSPPCGSESVELHLHPLPSACMFLCLAAGTTGVVKQALNGLTNVAGTMVCVI